MAYETDRSGRSASSSTSFEHRDPSIAFELGLGWLSLPTARVCDQRECVRGDGSPALELWGLYRPTKRWVFGAGGTFGFWPTKSIAQDEEDQTIHSRSYMLFELTGRYFPVVRTRLSWWVGPGLGLALVGDRFMQEELVHNQYERIGDPGAQLLTEGLSLFVGTGLAFKMTQHLELGATLRGGGLFFPGEPKTTPLGDRASVNGNPVTLSLGLVLAVSSPL